MTIDYLLIDGVLKQDALQWLYQSEGHVELYPLYTGTPWDELKALGPILVKLERSSCLLPAFQDSPVLQGQASWVRSRASLKAVARHLAQFITLTDNFGSNSLFRFADPLVTWHWLDSYSPSALTTVLGPVEAWQVAVLPPNWEPARAREWRIYRPDAEGISLPGRLNHLGDIQLQALEDAHRWRFKERIYHWLATTYPERLDATPPEGWGDWMDQRLAAASEWGLFTERSLVIWIERCLHWGDDFARHPDSPYHHWLVRTPHAAGLSPELRIQALDDDCMDS
ncbi:DUF4123 domain-containing protein [Metapseudomonas otitidis]|uniref:DUF4123 domain-containing protein n=1 Tax=Metapseudomonas otitidis TaxID=319939 RepID=UPI0013F5ACE4|nr:DUF4123 domain-containing protein [Pseudomonas otitidis]